MLILAFQVQSCSRRAFLGFVGLVWTEGFLARPELF